MSLSIKKGDMVMVKAARSFNRAGDSVVVKNQVGRVLAIFPKQGKALVEGLNLVKKHQKARGQNQPAGIHEMEAPLPLSKLMLVEPGGKGRAARFGVKIDAQGNKVRVLKLRGESKEVTV